MAGWRRIVDVCLPRSGVARGVSDGDHVDGDVKSFLHAKSQGVVPDGRNRAWTNACAQCDKFGSTLSIRAFIPLAQRLFEAESWMVERKMSWVADVNNTMI